MKDMEQKMKECILACPTEEGKQQFQELLNKSKKASFLKKLFLKNPPQEDPELLQTFSNLIYQYLLLPQYPHDLKGTFCQSLASHLKITTCLEQKGDHLFKVYPFDPSLQQLEEDYYDQLKQISIRYLQTEGTSLFELVSETSNQWKERVKEEQTFLKQADFLPYYGTIDYMITRSNYIVECMLHALLEGSLGEEATQAFEQALKKAKESLLIIQSYKPPFSKETYQMIENEYQVIRTLEDQVAPYLQKNWQEFLSDPNQYQEGAPFAFLAHFLSEEVVVPEKFSKVCLTLLTNQQLVNPVGAKKSGIGYLYPMDLNKLVSAEPGDMGSWTFTKEEWIERDFLNTWQYEPNANCPLTYFDDATISKLLLPQTLEQTCVNQNLIANKEALNYDSAFIFPELYFGNQDQQFQPCAVFVYETIYDTTKEKKIAAQLANQLDLPLVVLSKALYRQQQNLDPYTQSELQLLNVIEEGSKAKTSGK